MKSRSNIPIRWHNVEMIAHEAVIISPPYRPEDCKGSAQKFPILTHISRKSHGLASMPVCADRHPYFTELVASS